MAPFANTAEALAAAERAASAGIPYSTAIQTSGLLRGFRSDCSGFVDYILAKSGYSVGGDTTVSFPSAMLRGQGTITLWDRPQPGQLGHVIIDIAGHWFESGGMLGKGPSAITPQEAAAELGVSNISQLGSGATPRGFIPLHPRSTGAAGATSITGSTVVHGSLAKLWMSVGGNPGLADTMAAIAMAESGGQVGAVGGPNSDGTYDYGLWQINSSHSQYHKTLLLTVPQYNAKAAVAIERSQGLKAWTTYTSGAYKKYLGGAANAQYSGKASSAGTTRPGGESSSAPAPPPAYLTDYQTLVDTSGSTPPPGTDFTVFGLKGLAGTLSDILNPALWLAGQATHGVGTLEHDVSQGVTDVTHAFDIILQVLNPYNWLRAVEFLTGLGMMGYGINMMIKNRGQFPQQKSDRPSVAQTAAMAVPFVGEEEMGAVAAKRIAAKKGTSRAQIRRPVKAKRVSLDSPSHPRNLVKDLNALSSTSSSSSSQSSARSGNRPSQKAIGPGSSGRRRPSSGTRVISVE